MSTPSQAAASAREAARSATGEFGVQQRSEVEMDLGGGEDEGFYDHDAGFQRTVTVNYSVYEIPPRHRKERLVNHTFEGTVSVPEVTAEDAPVGFTVAEGNATQGYRCWNGNIYRPYLPFAHQTEPSVPGSKHFPAEFTMEKYDIGPDVTSQATAAIAAQREMNKYLVIDGVAWKRVGEPRYVVMTFGLGSNHGGTSLSSTIGDNPNISPSSYFRADDFESARAYALEVAQERGDTESVARIERQSPDIEVADPSALRLVNPGQESREVRKRRFDYDSAASAFQNMHRHGSARSAEDEQEAWKNLVAAREHLSEVTGDVTGREAEQRPYEQGREPL